MQYNAKKEWQKLYIENQSIAYPAEGVIRILKGKFPRLKMPKPTSGNILDLGCGDGRHFPLFEQVGLNGYGTEITEKICNVLKKRLRKLNINFADIQSGTNDCLPFDNSFFDYLLSWNSCYYMTAGKILDFKSHILEMARVIKKGGWLICSIPKKSSFIFNNSALMENKEYRILDTDPWGDREGEIMRCFNSREEIVEEFGVHFNKFNHADLDIDWFGLSYHWHVFVAKKK